MRKEHSIGLCLILLVAKCETSKPNILLIVADDLGYNDVSWHNPDIISPNLKKLAQDGLLLEQAYVEPICTPTRSSLLTGYYPSSVGRQVIVIRLPLIPDLPVYRAFSAQRYLASRA